MPNIGFSLGTTRPRGVAVQIVLVIVLGAAALAVLFGLLAVIVAAVSGQL